LGKHLGGVFIGFLFWAQFLGGLILTPLGGKPHWVWALLRVSLEEYFPP